MAITDIKGLTAPGPNNEYQELIRDAVWKAILLATRDDATNRAYLRNRDVIFALVDVQATLASSSKTLTSPTKVSEFSDMVAERLRVRTLEAMEARTNHDSIADTLIDIRRPN
jgi:hypothetical protein